MTTYTDKIIELCKLGTLSASEIAAKIGCRRQQVYAVATKRGLSLPDARKINRSKEQVRPNGIGAPRSIFIERLPGIRLSPQTAGSAAELLACADLMFRGWHVYRAQSPNCPADLIIWRGDRIIRVEVRTARREATGSLLYAQPTNRIYEVLALVDQHNSVEYRGPLGGIVTCVDTHTHL